MKKILLFAVVATLFAACTQEVVVDVTPSIADGAPETLIVGFEGDDTRIQLNEAQKTVWTKGDQVSVFYFSDANQLWQYNGETGSRTANLKRVNAGESTAQTTYNVVAYPFNEDYFLNTRTGALHATLPATQHYLKDSYGVGDNLMVAQSEFTQFSLKNVCGWLKLQLTGDGEVVKSITFKGNDGEQVAGLIHVDTATAEATLASEMGSADDNNAGGNLVFDDTILTAVTLDCGTGVTLGAEATAFYIAIPPQTFEKGFKVEIVCADDTKMVKSSSNTLTIERNHIQPTASVKIETTSGYENGHEWIDLGVSVKWASCNVGATTPEEYGDYFAWGETSPKADYYDYNYVTMGDISGDPEYDAATANWGGSWRMPTMTEQQELLNNCTWIWTSLNGIKGMQVTGPNGNSIFLPAAGYREGSSSYSVGLGGTCWSSTPSEADGYQACSLDFNHGGYGLFWFYRNEGQSVRPVSD